MTGGRGLREYACGKGSAHDGPAGVVTSGDNGGDNGTRDRRTASSETV